MAEGSSEKYNQGKQFEGHRHDHRVFKYAKKEKRDKFLDILRQEGFMDDQFELLSDDKIKEISDTIGRKMKHHGGRREITVEQIRLDLKRYYYEIKLEEVKQESRASRHNRKNGQKIYKTLHEESPEAFGSAQSSQVMDQHPDFPNKVSVSQLDSADEGFEHVTFKDVQFNLEQQFTISGKYHPGENQQFGKGTGEASPALDSNFTDHQQKQQQQHYQQQQQQQHYQQQQQLYYQQQPSTTAGETVSESNVVNDTANDETSTEAQAIPVYENLEADREHSTTDQQEARDHSGSSTGKASKRIENIQSEADIKTLSNKQLKEILRTNAIECNNIYERNDLLILVQRLWEHIQGQQQEYSITSECIICMNARIDCAFLECGHMVVCLQCGKNLKDCPMCRNYITRAVRIFRN